VSRTSPRAAGSISATTDWPSIVTATVPSSDVESRSSAVSATVTESGPMTVGGFFTSHTARARSPALNGAAGSRANAL
jgi:hypothetical protein